MMLDVAVRPCVSMITLHVNFSVGSDARKAALDGFPARQIVASDLRRGENGSSSYCLAAHTQFSDHGQSSGILGTYSFVPVPSHFQRHSWREMPSTQLSYLLSRAVQTSSRSQTCQILARWMIFVEKFQLFGLPHSSMSVSHHPLLDF